MNRFEDRDVHDPLPVEEEVQDSVVEWLARDSRDHVALFTAVTKADVAPTVMDALDAHRRAVGAILGEAPTTRSVFGPPIGTERGERWRAVVERGLFVFAAHRSGGPYWIAEAPTLPVHVTDLPATASELLGQQPPVALPFKHVASLMPETLGHPRRTGMTGGRLS
jgi:hypothetical protein